MIQYIKRHHMKHENCRALRTSQQPNEATCHNREFKHNKMFV
jgi:hypothetical protein